jgi:hypothetical protein
MKSVSSKFANHARLRRENAQRVCAEPGEYKICVGCLSIFFRVASLCAFCKGYRWHYDPEVVKLIAGITEHSALPFTAGVAPRLVLKEKQSCPKERH